MKFSLKSFVMGFLVATMISTGTMVFAENTEMIQAVFGRVKLIVDGKQTDKETLLYNGTTYVPLRAVGEILNLEVNWDEKTSTAKIDFKVINQTEDTSTALSQASPQNPSEGLKLVEPVKEDENTNENKNNSKNIFKNKEELREYLQKNYGELKTDVNDREFYKLHFEIIEKNDNYQIMAYIDNGSQVVIDPLVPKRSFSASILSYTAQEIEEMIEAERVETERYLAAMKEHTLSMAKELNEKMPDSNLFGYYRYGYGSDIRNCWSNYGVFDTVQDAVNAINNSSRKDEIVLFEAIYMYP